MTARPDDGEDRSEFTRGPEEEIHPSLASDPRAAELEAHRGRSGLPATIGWMVAGLLLILGFVLLLRLIEPPQPGLPAKPDVIVPADQPPSNPPQVAR